jgi:hypothetical protein
MLEFIGLVVVVFIVSFIFDAWLSDDVDFTITNGEGKTVWEYHKHSNEKNDKKNKKDLKDGNDL